MTRVIIICEGPTEETFVNDVLKGSLAWRGVYLHAALIGKPGHKGGRYSFERLKRDLRVMLHQDAGLYCTTFFDFYGLPEDFPGKQAASSKSTSAEKSKHLKNALVAALEPDIGASEMRRFIPYVQMHEFEGLLFSDPVAFARGIDEISLTSALMKIREAFPTPEDINNSKITAPSKRILKLHPVYQKPTHGSLAAQEIGLTTIRRECPIFDGWLQDIESLGPATASS